jgi:DUF971 family protein
MTKAPIPAEIRLHRKSRLLEVSYGDGRRYELPCEYLRVYSPSAEVRGHGPGQEILLVGKEKVGITAVEPVGHYALRLRFDDGHDSGLYTWEYLDDLGRKMNDNWQAYLDRLREAGYKRRDASGSEAKR